MYGSSPWPPPALTSAICTWASVSPGMTTAPPPSMDGRADGPPPAAIREILPFSTITSTRSRGSAPVQSSRSAPRITKLPPPVSALMPFLLKYGPPRGRER